MIKDYITMVSYLTKWDLTCSLLPQELIHPEWVIENQAIKCLHTFEGLFWDSVRQNLTLLIDTNSK